MADMGRIIFQSIGVLALTLFCTSSAYGEDFLQTAQTLWYDGSAVPPTTLKMNLRGISAANGLNVLRAAIGGKLEGDTITGSKLGTIRLVPRLIEGRRDGVEFTVETPTSQGIARLDEAWTALSKNGARGERNDQPPKVRVQFNGGDVSTSFHINANMLRADHVKQMRDFGGMSNGGGVTAVPELGTIELNLQDGSLVAPVKQAIGVYQISRKEGAIDHDRWVQSSTGLDREMLPALRKQFVDLRNGDRTQTIAVRYLLGDPEHKRDKASPWHDEIAYHQPPIGAMRADQQGETPLILRPGAAVWHPRVHHQNNILGDANPALINGELAELLTSNKWFEALWFEKHLPGAMSRTEHLKEIYNQSQVKPDDVGSVLSELNRRFPKGWVLKALKESHTGRFVVTDKLEVAKLIGDYRNSDFDQFYQRALIELAGQDEDNMNDRLQQHPAYLGWKLAKFLSDPDNVIAQERVDIVSEFRVEGISGKVLGNYSTVDRYGHKVWNTEQQLPTFTDPKIIKAVEAYTQGLLDRLPPKLRGTPFAFDIALLKDGSFTVIEGNAGPESGYFVDFRFSVKAMNHFLRQYQQLARDGKIVSTGMSPKQMHDYLNGLFRQWNIDPETNWPHLKVNREWDPAHPHTVESRFERTTQSPEFYRVAGDIRPAICPFPSMAPETHP